MSEAAPPPPWRDGPEGAGPQSEAARLMRAGAQDLEVSEAQKRQGWREIEQRLSAPEPKSLRWALPAGVALALSLAAVLVLAGVRTRQWRAVEMEGVAQLSVARDTRYRLEGTRVELSEGKIRAQVRKQAPGHSFAIVTPHLTAVVVGTRFQVSADGQGSRVEVEEGQVQVERGSRSLMVGPGESVSSTDARFDAPEEAEPVGPPCGTESSLASKRSCFERLALGTGVAAQNALFALALLARDEEHDPAATLVALRQYQARFPAGLLAPEVSVAAFNQLVAAKRRAEALAEAESFRKRFPSDPRAREVALAQAGLLCQHKGGLEQAQAAFEAALVPGGTAAAREEALWAQASCVAAFSRSQATSLWEGYLDQFPSGAHAEQARRLLERPR